MTFDPAVFIVCRDRVRDLRALVAWLEAAGHRNLTLIDCASTWPPLLEYLADSPHRVVRAPNLGKLAPWRLGLVPHDDWYVVTDPDVVPTAGCPTNLLRRLRSLLLRHEQFPKAGPGLLLEDVPPTMTSLAWERSLMSADREIEPGVFASPIDTTLALYRPGSGFDYHALRTGPPYLARHGPWYVTDPDDEDRYYLTHAQAGPHASSWAPGHQSARPSGGAS